MAALFEVLRYLLARVPQAQEEFDRIAALIDDLEHLSAGEAQATGSEENQS